MMHVDEWKAFFAAVGYTGGLLLVHPMNAELSQRLLHDMMRIRAVEEAIVVRYSEQKMRCPVHLSIGQEAPSAAAAWYCVHDLAVSGHRAHAHYLAKGGDLSAMIAEIYGKATGCACGKGGSMHLVDERAGFMGSTAIVGGTVPVGVGLALAKWLAKGDDIVCIFIGDAVLETGVFFESANFAVLRRLPVLFLCENNLYSVYSPLTVRQPSGRSLAGVAAGIGLSTSSGDGNDVQAAHDLIAAAVGKIRAGGGPQFVELATYRWREHCGPLYDNDIGYRTVEEFEKWKLRDPVAAFHRPAARSEGHRRQVAQGDRERASTGRSRPPSGSPSSPRSPSRTSALRTFTAHEQDELRRGDPRWACRGPGAGPPRHRVRPGCAGPKGRLWHDDVVAAAVRLRPRVRHADVRERHDRNRRRGGARWLAARF